MEAPPEEAKRTPWKWIAVAVAAVVVVGVVVATLLFQAPGPRTVTYAYTSEMVTLDPSTEFSNSIIVLHQLYEPLTYYDPATDEAAPGLASSWSVSEDDLAWTFNLRSGVVFHDGTPLTADAVKFSIDRTVRMFEATGEGAGFIWFPVESIEVVDDLTVRFHLLWPTPLDIVVSAGYGAFIMSPNIPEDDQEAAAWFNAGNSAGTGPWLIESYDPRSEIILTRFDDYWGGWEDTHFERAVIRIVSETAGRELAVTTGAADIAVTPPVASIPTLQANPDVEVFTGPAFLTLYAFFNTEKAPLDNASVRQALAYAMPYQDVVSIALGGLGAVSKSYIPRGMFGHGDLSPYTMDLDAAEALLVQAGHPRPETGFRFTLTLTHLIDEPFETAMATLYKEKLDDLAINLDVRPMPWVEQWGLATSDPLAAQDIFVMYWWPTYITPYDFLFSMYHCEDEPFFNLGYYCNPAFDGLIDDAAILEGADRDAALAMYLEAQGILFEDVPAIPIFDRDDIFVYRADLEGFVDNPAYPQVVFFYQLRGSEQEGFTRFYAPFQEVGPKRDAVGMRSGDPV